MMWVDYAILAILGVSAAISVWRGFVREALSLAGWIVAFWVALSFTREMAVYLIPYLSAPSVRLVVAFLILFFLTLIIAAVVNYLGGQLVEKTGLSGTDRVLGIFFGLARGGLIVAVLLLLAGATAIPQDAWWDQSTFIPHFQPLTLWLRELLPDDVAAYFNY